MRIGKGKTAELWMILTTARPCLRKTLNSHVLANGKGQCHANRNKSTLRGLTVKEIVRKCHKRCVLVDSQDPETHAAVAWILRTIWAQTPNSGLLTLKPLNNSIIASSLSCLLEGPQLNSNNLIRCIRSPREISNEVHCNIKINVKYEW